MNTYMVRFKHGKLFVHAEDENHAKEKAIKYVTESVQSCEPELLFYTEYGEDGEGFRWK